MRTWVAGKVACAAAGGGLSGNVSGRLTRPAATMLCLVAVAGWGALTAATSSAKPLTFLPCADLQGGTLPASLMAARRSRLTWVFMPHPSLCTEYRGKRTPEQEVPLEDIHWHRWGSRRAIGRGRWLTSAEFPEESAPVTLTAYRLFDPSNCIFRAGGYTRLRVETTDGELPPRIVFKLPTCIRTSAGKPSHEIGGHARRR
jgi:hypothetical protein